MTDFLQLLLSLSISGSLLALAVAGCIRLLRRHLPQAFGYYVWLLVVARLLLPVTVPDSLMARTFAAVPQSPAVTLPAPPENQSGQDTAVVQPTPQIRPQSPAAGSMPQQAMPDELPQQMGADSPAEIPWGSVLFLLWSAGAAVCLIWHGGAYLRYCAVLRRSARPACPQDEALFRQEYPDAPVRLFCSDRALTPMLVGFVRPVVYLPAGSWCAQGRQQELRLALRHEMTHYRRRDLWVKWLALLAAAVHWFNPVVWWVVRRIGRACELSCDEAVVLALPEAQRKLYGETLLQLSARQALPGNLVATTLSEEGKALKERLMGIFEVRRVTAGVAALMLAAVLALAGCGAVLGAADGSNNGSPQSAASSHASNLLAPANWMAQPEQNHYFLFHLFDQSDGSGLLYTQSDRFPDEAALNAALDEWSTRQNTTQKLPQFLWAIDADYDGDSGSETFFACGIPQQSPDSTWAGTSLYLLDSGVLHYVADGVSLVPGLLRYDEHAQLLLWDAALQTSEVWNWNGTRLTRTWVQGAEFAQHRGVLYAWVPFETEKQPVPVAAAWNEQTQSYQSIPWQEMPPETAQEWMPWVSWRITGVGPLQRAAQLNQNWMMAVYSPAEGETTYTVRFAQKDADAVWKRAAEWQWETSALFEELMDMTWQTQVNAEAAA